MDPLYEVPSERLDPFLKTLKSCEPDGLSAYATITTTLEWIRKDPRFKGTLLTIKEGEEKGTCVYIFEGFSVPRLTIFAVLEDDENLCAALITTTKIPWHLNPVIQRLNERTWGQLKDSLSSKLRWKINSPRMKMHWLPSEIALSLQETPLPADLRIRKLEEADTATIAEKWSYGGAESEELIRNTIRYNLCLGVEHKSGVLKGWVLWGQCGGLANLFVDTEFRRHGLARVLMTKLAKILAENGFEPVGNVAINNSPSLNLFTSLGFKHAFYNFYGRTELIEQ